MEEKAELLLRKIKRFQNRSNFFKCQQKNSKKYIIQNSSSPSRASLLFYLLKKEVARGWERTWVISNWFLLIFHHFNR
jgi:hypothetical protein